MPKQTIEMCVNMPDGWEWTGEYRRAGCGEKVLGFNPSRVVEVIHHAGTEGECLILRRKEPVRESRWVVVCDSLHGYSSLEEAQRNCTLAELRVERRDYEDYRLVAVTLEPLGEEPQ